MERTLVLVKPDGVQRGLIGEVLSRLERRGLKVVGAKMLWMGRPLAEEHYRDHRGKDFFEPLVEFIIRSPIVALGVEGPGAIALVRKMMGALNPLEAEPGSIRGDLTPSKQMNIVHGSDSPESAARELSLFFRQEELFDYERDVDRWTTGE